MGESGIFVKTLTNKIQDKNMVKRILSRLFLLSLVAGSLLQAQTTGKIAGIISDAASGEPMMGVNVWLEDTDHGASSSVDGDFYINTN